MYGRHSPYKCSREAVQFIPKKSKYFETVYKLLKNYLRFDIFSSKSRCYRMIRVYTQTGNIRTAVSLLSNQRNFPHSASSEFSTTSHINTSTMQYAYACILDYLAEHDSIENSQLGSHLIVFANCSEVILAAEHCAYPKTCPSKH